MGIELTRPTPGQHNLGKAPAATSPLDSLGAGDAPSGFADMMSSLSIGPQQAPVADAANSKDSEFEDLAAGMVANVAAQPILDGFFVPAQLANSVILSRQDFVQLGLPANPALVVETALTSASTAPSAQAVVAADGALSLGAPALGAVSPVRTLQPPLTVPTDAPDPSASGLVAVAAPKPMPRIDPAHLLSGASTGQRIDPSQLAAQQAVSVPTTLAANAMLAQADLSIIQTAENLQKPLGKRLGLGAESFYGQASSVVSPLVDTTYQVAPSSAVVADGALAETVSYWAAHGVQNATMQLDGLGSEPVEVSISMNGDMAQVDFRTNQVDVQQAIKAEAGQLKDMLLSQGLQLAGFSIGQSGQGGQADKGQKQAGEAKKIAMVDSQFAAEPQRGRSLNLSVGQSLDLFV